MKLIRLSTYALLAAMLVGCSGNEESEDAASNKDEQTEQETEVSEQKESENKSVKNEENEHEALINEALAFAGESTAHEGTLTIQEQIDQGTQTLVHQTLEIEYAQNEMTGSDEEGYQLMYKKSQQSSAIDYTVTSTYFHQPGVADYKFYEPENFWHANDYSQIDASIEERLDFMSPYDALLLYEALKDEAEVIIDDETMLTLAFDVNEDLATEFELDYQFLEPESFLYTGIYLFSPESYTVMLEFDKEQSILNSVHVEAHYKDADDETVTMMIQSFQTFNSYMLTGEITPPEEAFAETGISKWGF